MCEAIDKFTINRFIHVLVDDNSNEYLHSAIPSTSYRKVLRMDTDYPELMHKNNLGQGVQLAWDFAHFQHLNEIPFQPFDHTFLIESDCVVHEGWDEKMIEISETLPNDWASLDCQSVDEEDKLTYPTVISPRYGFITPELEHQHYADFQCTLFNPLVLPDKLNVKFSDFRSHFDILWSRKVEELTSRRHFRTMLVKLTHYASSSRDTLPKT
jgi:hypothetical protein